MKNLVKTEIPASAGANAGDLIAGMAIDRLLREKVDLGDESVNRALADEEIRRGIMGHVGRYVRAAIMEGGALASLKIDQLDGPADTGVNVASLAVVPCRALTAEDRCPGAREDHADTTETPRPLLDEQHSLVIRVHGGIVEGMPDPAMIVRKIRSMSALAIASGGEVRVCLDRVADGVAASRPLTGEQTPLSVGRLEFIGEQQNMVLVFPGHILDRKKFDAGRLQQTDTHGEVGPTPASAVFQHALKPRASLERFNALWK